jgi:hypothetical protein
MNGNVVDHDQPVDGFTVEARDGWVWLTLSDRYGEGTEYGFVPHDAYRIGAALMGAARAA